MEVTITDVISTQTGDQRGHRSDWITQRWVRATGRAVDVRQSRWLDGPIGAVTGIGRTFVADLARSDDLVVRDASDAGLLPTFAVLAAADFDPVAADPHVVDFYTHTAHYEMDSWAEWCATAAIGVSRQHSSAIAIARAIGKCADGRRLTPVFFGIDDRDV